MKIAVLDLGFEWHEDFDTSLWVDGYDFYYIDSNPAPEPSSFLYPNSHGMTVLGLIAGRHNDLVTDPMGHSSYASTAAISPGTKVIPVKMGSNNSIANVFKISDAIRYSSSKGAAIISGSWGYPFIPIPDVLRNAVDSAAIYGRSGKGCVLVFAAGNGIGYPDTLLYPARDTAVLGIGAIQFNDIRFSYSQFQAGVLDIMAPSVALDSADAEYSCTHKYYGDADCSGSVNVVDLTFLVQYVFQGGPAPQKPCIVTLPD